VQDNNIEFWRKFVAEFFAPNAKKRWCVSLYGSGRQTTGVLPQVCLASSVGYTHQTLLCGYVDMDSALWFW